MWRRRQRNKKRQKNEWRAAERIRRAAAKGVRDLMAKSKTQVISKDKDKDKAGKKKVKFDE